MLLLRTLFFFISSNTMKISQKGFTLIELLVVISIIGMLSSVIMVSLQGARDKGIVGSGIKFATYNQRLLGVNAHVRYDFDDPVNIYKDASGNSYNASVSTNVATSTDTPSGSGRSMSVTGNAAVAATITRPISTNDFTLSVWVKPTSLSAAATPVVSPSLPNTYPALSLSSTAVIFGSSATYNTPVPIGKWSQITYSYSAATNRITAYINGKQVGSYAVAAITLSTPLTFLMFGVVTPYNGIVDDVSFYGQKLLAHEIEDIYAQEAEARGIAIK